jgi:hypothetical protein
MHKCVRTDVGPVGTDMGIFFILFSVCADAALYIFFNFLIFKKEFSFFLKILFRPRGWRSHPRGRTYSLTFFLGGWKCKVGIDLRCGRKHFFDQISNPYI